MKLSQIRWNKINKNYTIQGNILLYVCSLHSSQMGLWVLCIDSGFASERFLVYYSEEYKVHYYY